MTTAILIHGMGRTPLSMLLLAARLRLGGMRPKLFGYSATFEGWRTCKDRLIAFIEKNTVQEKYILVGHSLGTVLARTVITEIENPPQACFLLAPPTQACMAARKLARRKLYRWCTGEMGQLLASQQFMNELPRSDIPTKIYAGTGGLTGRYSPFGEKLNDGVLAVDEARLPDVPLEMVPAIHTCIMNAKLVAKDIIKLTDIH